MCLPSSIFQGNTQKLWVCSKFLLTSILLLNHVPNISGIYWIFITSFQLSSFFFHYSWCACSVWEEWEIKPSCIINYPTYIVIYIHLTRHPDQFLHLQLQIVQSEYIAHMRSSGLPFIWNCHERRKSVHMDILRTVWLISISSDHFWLTWQHTHTWPFFNFNVRARLFRK